MAKVCGTDAIQGIAVETWVSATGHPDISAFTNPYPGDVRHHISVTSNASYPLDFFVHGLIASGFSQVAYSLTPIADKWADTIHQVQTYGEADCQMQISPVSSPARIQVERVEYDSPWSGRTAAP